MSEQVLVAPARYVTISLAALTMGLTEKAINNKIDRGDWAEGKEWHRAPDGRRYVDLKGVEKWVVRGAAR